MPTTYASTFPRTSNPRLGMTVWEAMRIAIQHATPIIEDDEDATDVTPDDLALATVALDKDTLTEDEVHALAAVVGLGAEYMDNNSYGEDQDFPEDAAAAQQLGTGDSAESLVRLVYGMESMWFLAGDPTPVSPNQETARRNAMERKPVPRIQLVRGTRLIAEEQYLPPTAWPDRGFWSTL